MLAVVAGLGVLLVAAGFVAVRLWTAPGDRVPAGVAIGGVAVGGLSADEAERAVLASAEPPIGTVEIALDGEPGFPRYVPVPDLAPVPRARRAVEQAIGSPSLGARILGEVGLESGRDVPLTFRATPARARAQARSVAEALDVPARAATVGVGGGGIVVGPARAGRAVDQVDLARRIGGLPGRVEVPLAEVLPAVDAAAAEAARAEAARISAGPVRVRGGGRQARIDRPTLLAALRFTPGTGRIAVTLDGATLAEAIAPAFEGVLQQPRPAGLAVEGDRVRVTASQDGRTIDAAVLARRVAAASGARRVRVPIAVEKPERTTAQAKALGIRELVGRFTTPYACCQPRVTNIRRAARILDRTIIPAGGTFSLNTTLGRRTRARGFVPAPQINAGRLEDAIGGGVSQMATTVYNAAFFSGLEIITHTPHEFWITRYPPGREATVSWGGPELVFRNDWGAAILMTVTATATSLTIRMYSTPVGRRVATVTTGDEPVAGTAFTVTTTRKVWRGDELRRDESFRWSYKVPPAGE